MKWTTTDIWKTCFINQEQRAKFYTLHLYFLERKQSASRAYDSKTFGQRSNYLSVGKQMFPYGTVSGSALYTKCRVLTCFHGEMEGRQRSQCGLNISQSPHSICCILLHLSVPAAMQFLLKHLLIPKIFTTKILHATGWFAILDNDSSNLLSQ